jgi:hypothetical protein
MDSRFTVTDILNKLLVIIEVTLLENSKKIARSTNQMINGGKTKRLLRDSITVPSHYS